MKKSAAVAALIIMLAVLALPGLARASSGSWFAQGSGTVLNTNPLEFSTPTIERWQWVATSPMGTPAAGAPAKGHFSERVPGTDIAFDADVNCLNVDGDTARIGITVRSSTNPYRHAGATTWITMTSIGHGFDALHLVGADGTNSALAGFCPPPSGARDAFYGTIGIRSEASPYSWLAQGSGNISFAPTQHWQWVALSDVGGGNARGHLSVLDSASGVGYDADVACLTVAGQSARIGFVVTSSTDVSRPTGTASYIHTTVTGQGSSEEDALLPDNATYPALDAAFRPISCTAPVPGGYPFDGSMNVRGG